ncbi:MAG: oligosaccharide flippase family protein [Nocardioidaceae bacterium]|nr:MAG: oligosaccharide flippase family protein [Nocardioidaceae bacterium]
MTLIGSMLSALLGFAFSILLAREFGAYNAGVVLQAIAIFTIGLSIAKLGLDTTAIWLLPPMRADAPVELRSALVRLLAPAFLFGLVLVGLWQVVQLGLSHQGRAGEVLDAVGASLWFLPFASLMTVALACSRAVGGVLPYNAIGNVLVPALRPAGLVAVAALGGGGLAVAIVWSVPWLIGAVAAVAVVAVLVPRTAGPRWPRPGRTLLRRIAGYSLPRTLASILEQLLLWMDVVLVGLILGSAAAGIYGSSSRFINLGLIVATSLRIVVAPRFSALMARREHAQVEQLYAVTARWILLFGGPAYALLFVFAPTVLGWLGEGFSDGVPVLRILCAGSLVVLAAGNVQSLLLMSGHSGWSALNKAIVVTVNIVGNIILLPVMGLVGAAWVWAACMVLDTVLAAFQVHRWTGIALDVKALAFAGMGVVVAAVAPAYVVAALFGQSTTALLVAGFVVLAATLAFAWLARRTVHLDELVSLGRSGR